MPSRTFIDSSALSERAVQKDAMALLLAIRQWSDNTASGTRLISMRSLIDERHPDVVYVTVAVVLGEKDAALNVNGSVECAKQTLHSLFSPPDDTEPQASKGEVVQ